MYASYQSTFGSPTQDVTIAAVGQGVDTAAGEIITPLPGVDTISASYADSAAKYPSLGLGVEKASPYQFTAFNLSSGVVAYITSNITNDSVYERGILKYSLVGTTWVFNGAIHAVHAISGITGIKSGDSVLLIATAPTRLYRAYDFSGWNQPPTDTAVYTVDTALANTQFRGVAFTPGAIPNLLPVTLKSFSGSLVNGFAQLTWATANETNTKGFEIEKSVDGKSFTAIGNVSANNKPSSYEFGDPIKLAGLQYYRLQITSKAGSYTYSPTVALSEKVGGKLSIFPNPVSTTATVSHTGWCWCLVENYFDRWQNNSCLPCSSRCYRNKC